MAAIARLIACIVAQDLIFKGRVTSKIFILFYWLLLNLRLSTVHIDFLLKKFLQKMRLVFTANCMRCSSIRFWCKKGVHVVTT